MKDKGKYIFHEDLKPYENQKVILIPGVVRILQNLMGVLYFREKDDESVHVTTRWITVLDNKKIRILIYEPRNCSENLPCLYFIHGGGFAFNAAPHHFQMARRFTRELNVRTVFVDYRLAPKYKFPTAPEDCLAVYQWILRNEKQLRIQTDRIMVCGDSAGGNLATVICLMAKDRGLPLPKLQMLLYPMTDRRMITQSCRKYVDTPMCNSKDIRKYLKMYVKDFDESKIPYFSPVEAPSLKGQPSAYIETAEYDCLHDEGVNYAEKLKKAGVPVTLYEIPQTIHGYDIAQKTPLIDQIMENRIRFIKRNLY